MLKKILLLILPICFFANELSASTLNQLKLDTENPTLSEPFKTINYTLYSTSFVPDKLGRTEPYSIRPMKNGIELSKYTVISYMPPPHTIAPYEPGYVVITINAEQNNNENVAKWAAFQQKKIFGFDDYIELTAYATHGGTSIDKEPQKLNYAFIGKITMTIEDRYSLHRKLVYTCSNIIFGQGHSGAQYNWWIYTNLKNQSNSSNSS